MLPDQHIGCHVTSWALKGNVAKVHDAIWHPVCGQVTQEYDDPWTNFIGCSSSLHYPLCKGLAKATYQKFTEINTLVFWAELLIIFLPILTILSSLTALPSVVHRTGELPQRLHATADSG